MKRVQMLYESGTGGVLLIQAEAGMGKTRFVQEVIVHITELCEILERQQKEAALLLANANATPADHTDRSRSGTPPLTNSARKLTAHMAGDDTEPPESPAKTPTLAPTAFKRHTSNPTVNAQTGATLTAATAANTDTKGTAGNEKEKAEKEEEEVAEEDQDMRRPLRYMFGSGYSMTNKVPYSIWRNIVSTLIAENAIANLQHRNDSRDGSMNERGGHGNADRNDRRDDIHRNHRYGGGAVHANPKRGTGGSTAATTIVDQKTRDLKPNHRTSARKSVSGATGVKVCAFFATYYHCSSPALRSDLYCVVVVSAAQQLNAGCKWL
jgi:hypothetical protein